LIVSLPAAASNGNVAADHPKTIASMQAIADQWLEKTQPVRPPNFYSNKKKE